MCRTGGHTGRTRTCSASTRKLCRLERSERATTLWDHDNCCASGRIFSGERIQQLWNLEVIELSAAPPMEASGTEIWREESSPASDLDGWNAQFHADTSSKCTNEAKTNLMRAATYAHRSRMRIEKALADHGRAQTAPARLTKGSKYEAKLDAIKVKDEANRKANRKLSFEARARKLVEGGDAPSLSTAKKWLRDLDSRQH